MTLLSNLITPPKFGKVQLPFGLALTNDDCKVAFFNDSPLQLMSYNASEGMRIWTEDLNVHEYPGEVVARMGSSYILSVANSEGTHLDVFPAVNIFAITPANIPMDAMRLALTQSYSDRTYH